MIKNKFIETLKENASIVEVVESYNIALKKKGQNHKGLCPFHEEKSPSFTVSEKKNSWKCFGCGKGGDVFEFVKLKENKQDSEFADIVKKVAGIMNMPVEYEPSNLTPEQKQKNKEKKDLTESLFIQNKAYWEKITELYPPEKWPIHDYRTDAKGEVTITVDCFGRGYKLETIKDFGLAIAPNDNWLVKQGKKAGFNPDLLQDAGLVGDSGKGKYDYFRGRLLFPIYNRQDKIAGFGGRVHPHDPYKDKKAKYLNNPELEGVYHKSKILYGLPQALPSISDATNGGRAILVEGYTDVVTMHEHGFKNTVGSCNNFLTKEQAALLKKHCKEVVLFIDTDPKFSKGGKIEEWPGRKSAHANIRTCIEAGLMVKIFILPIPLDTSPQGAKRIEGYRKKSDPDSFLREHGARALTTLMQETTEDALEWLVKYIYEVDGRDKTTEAYAFDVVAELLAYIESDYTRSGYVKSLSSSKFLKCKESILASAVIDKKEKSTEKKSFLNGFQLSASQNEMLNRYGFYLGKPRGCKSEVFMALDKDGYFPITLANLRVEPDYHVFSENTPERKIKVYNTDGICRIVDLHTDVFEEFKSFCKCMAALGNFRFTQNCKGHHFHGIVTWIYENMPSVLRIEKLGQHTTGEMFVWGNGVTLNDGVFHHKQENGLIQVGDETYKVPGNTDQDEQKKKLDNSRTTDSHHESFLYVEGGCPSWPETIEMIWGVHGKNGILGVAYYLLCLYRSNIYPQYTQEFPILNGEGPPTKGKSQLWFMLSSFFGMPEKAEELSNITKPYLSALLSSRRDAVVGLDEYSNSLDKTMIESLKSISEGKTRSKMGGKDFKSMDKGEVLCGAYIFGQQIPTSDIALFTRMVSLAFYDFDNSKEAMERFEKYRTIRQSGVFSQHTSHLQQYRGAIQKNILEAFTHVKSELKKEFSPDVKERVMNSYSWLLAVVWVLQDHVKFPSLEDGKTFYETLFTTAKEYAKKQFKIIGKEDENATFWSVLQRLVTSVPYPIKHKEHIWVSDEVFEKFYETETSKDSRLVEWADFPRRLIYINVDLIHQVYKEGFNNSDGKKPLTKESLYGYLENDKDCLGRKKAKKLGGVARTVLVFDIGSVQLDDEGDTILVGGLSNRGFALPTNNEAKRLRAEKWRSTNDAAPEDENTEPPKEEKKDLPF